jgi:hypothetical protein
MSAGARKKLLFRDLWQGMAPLENTVALVTGASSGIGATTARSLAARCCWRSGRGPLTAGRWM